MEKDTVLLSLGDYNELRDFKSKLENGDFLVSIKMYRNGVDVNTYKAKIYTKDDTIRMLTDANKTLQNEILGLSEQLSPSPKEITLEDIKKMSYWEFRRWKKIK